MPNRYIHQLREREGGERERERGKERHEREGEERKRERERICTRMDIKLQPNFSGITVIITMFTREKCLFSDTVCANGGTPDTETCECECANFWSGDVCETCDGTDGDTLASSFVVLNGNAKES